MKKKYLQIPLDPALHQQFLSKVTSEGPRIHMTDKVREWILAYVQSAQPEIRIPVSSSLASASPTKIVSVEVDPEKLQDPEAKVDRLLEKIL